MIETRMPVLLGMRGPGSGAASVFDGCFTRCFYTDRRLNGISVEFTMVYRACSSGAKGACCGSSGEFVAFRYADVLCCYACVFCRLRPKAYSSAKAGTECSPATEREDEARWHASDIALASFTVRYGGVYRLLLKRATCGVSG